jgi:hypothetical protein
MPIFLQMGGGMRTISSAFPPHVVKRIELNERGELVQS